MKKRISSEELSAYLDGEAKNPAKVRQQLQESDDAARMYRALSKVSAHVRSLPVASVRSGFSGRVLASLEAQKPRRSSTWPVPVWVSLGATAVAAVLVMIGVNDTVESPDVQTAASMPAIYAPPPVALEEDVLVAELERRISSGAESGALLSEGLYEETDPIEELPAELLLALVPADWVDSLGGLNETADYRVEMNALSDSEKVIFAQLLDEYARVEKQGPSAQEG